MRRDLIPHPDSYAGAVSGLSAAAARAGPALSLNYRLTGVLDRIVIPSPAAPERTDALWKHTCFEAFIRTPGADSYVELNFSPSSQWAAYGFTGYREGMSPLDIPPPRIERAMKAGSLDLTVSLTLAGLAEFAAAPWRVALTAVIEDATSARSYWALAHPPGKPDFHRADGFVLELTNT